MMEARRICAEAAMPRRLMGVYLVAFVCTLLAEMTASQISISVPGLSAVDKAMIASPGDINFGYMTIVRFSSDNKRSCDIRLRTSCATSLEILKFALQALNKRTDLLPNITVGYVAVDDCGTPIRALEVSAYFVNNTADSNFDKYANNSGIDVDDAKPQSSRNVVAVVGPASSPSASLASSFLSIFQIPHLATSATSDLLSDKTIYEYFLRLLSPDSFQIRAILDLCQRLGWTYVSLVYSEGSYGENAASKIDNYLRDTSNNYSICLATSQKIYADSDAADLDRVFSTLLEYENVNVVILFLSGAQQLTFFNEARRMAGVGRFLWLAGDFIATLLTRFSDILEGAVYIGHPCTEMPDFKGYMETINPASDEGNVWLSDYWEEFHSCYLNDLLNKTGKECKQPIVLTEDVCPTVWPAACRVYDAVFVIGSAIHRLVTDRCPRAFAEKWILKECISGPVLLDYLYNTDAQGRIGRIRFDSSGNVQEQLLFLQYQRLESGYSSVSIGQWSPVDGAMTFDSSKVSWGVFRQNYVRSYNSVECLASVCSLPCKSNEYIISGEVSCCWTCRTCRDNEIIAVNGTACQSCPLFYWPDDNGTSCEAIEPTYLHPSHPISACLLVMAALGGTLGLTVLTIYIVKRRHKLVMATNILLCFIILFGTLVVSSAIFVFVIPPDVNGICTVRSFGFHCGISLLYAPLFVKNILTYRIFTAGTLKNIALKSTKIQLTVTAAIFTIQVSDMV
jgi:hypothetical protein